MIDVLALILTIVLFTIPGIVASFALLKGTDFTLLEKKLVGVAISFIAIPSLSLIEFVFIGIKFTPMLVFANYLLVLLAGIALIAYQGFSLPQLDLSGIPFAKGKFDWQKHKQFVYMVALILILAFTFWSRFSTSWAPNFFEFDPIFYSHVTEILVKDGSIPVESNEVYFPSTKDMRVFPLVAYLGGSFYNIYHTIVGGEFIKTDFSLVIQMYPPLTAILAAFFSYLLFRKHSNELTGLVAAGVFAGTPQLVNKFGAGVNELQPWGLFTAIAIFATVLIAASSKSYRLSFLAGIMMFAGVIGSAQHVWPVTVVAAFMLFHAVVGFYRDEIDKRTVLSYAIMSLPPLAGGLIYNLYKSGFSVLQLKSITSFFYGESHLILVGALLLLAFFFAVSKYAIPVIKTRTDKPRLAVFGAMALAAIIVMVAVPAIPNALGAFLNSTAGFARQLSALGMTVAEENAVSPGLYFGSFGYLNPDILLPACAILVCLFALIRLLLSGHRLAAGWIVVMVLLITVFNSILDAFLLGISNTFFTNYALFTQFITGSDVFVYMLAAIFSMFMLLIMVKETDIPIELMLLVIAVFPVAYIGLNKLKFMPHLALALTIAFPFALALGFRIVASLGALLSSDSDRNFARRASLAMIILIGGLMVYAQSTTVEGSMQGLQYTRISGDWISSYDWMKTAPSFQKDFCTKEYGYDCRVLSWWDYGHWTTYFGEKKSVLDPGNRYPDYNQGVARALVHGIPSDLLYSVRFHQATHILVDAQLIQKWGALVFLSGSCSSAQYATCPQKAEIDFKNGAGRSTYEAEHYFEFMNSVGNCPAQLTGVALPAFRSSLTNAVYCFTDNEYLLLGASGIDPNYKRKYKIVGRDQYDANNLEKDTSYLFGYAQGQFINVNPGLSYVNLNNTVIDAPFTRLFFFENYPGMTLEHRSPTGEVKIFKISRDYITGATQGTSVSTG